MKLLNKFCLSATAVLVCVASLALPAAAAKAPYALHLESAGTTGVQVRFEPVNSSVKAFQVSFAVGDSVKPGSVTWNPAITSTDLKECIYDEETNTLNLYVVSEANLVKDNQLAIGTINFVPKDATASTAQYDVSLKPGDNIVFVDNTNQALRYDAPALQGETNFTYQKPPSNNNQGSSGGGSGGTITLVGGNKDKEKPPVTDSSKPVVEPPTQEVVPTPPAITSPVTSGGSMESLPPLPTVEDKPEESPTTTPNDATTSNPTEPTPEVVAPLVVPEPTPQKFPIAWVIGGGVIIAGGVVAFLKVKHII